METLNITFQTENQNQIDAVKAFFKALKIKHTMTKENTKMTKDEYFEMLNNRIKNQKLTNQLQLMLMLMLMRRKIYCLRYLYNSLDNGYN